MNTNKFDLDKFNLTKFNEILGRGLCHGVGSPNGQMCIEAAICAAAGLPHGDDPGCVALSVRSFKISLNDSAWSSPQARAEGLRKLGLAQLGSLEVVEDGEFLRKLSKKLIQKLIPKLFREIFKDEPKCLAAADQCEKEGTADAARYAATAAARYATAAARYAADAAAADAAATAATDAADAARYAADAAARYAADAAARYAADAAAADAKRDEYLTFVADLALEVLVELNSPGVELLNK